MKRDSKIFLELPKKQNAFSKTPLSNSVFQIPPQSKSTDPFLLKLKAILTTCLKHDIWHNKLKDNVCGQIYS